MPGGIPALHAIIELGIGADRVVANQKPRRLMRVLGNDAFGQRDDRIAAALNAEDDLIIGIIEAEGRA